MTLTRTTAVAAAIAISFLAGCAQTEQQQRATGGAALGAVGGALVGQAIGRNTESTLIGAGAGALLGAVVATSSGPQPRGEEMCRYRARDGRIFVAPCDERYYSRRNDYRDDYRDDYRRRY
ncbi:MULTISPECIES: YMGG-like glycine zipper-containing protein [unclassified Mesorhizobium]|uniref:YMGG-like glycine zipper-containing protein n=1 Tax=unclassified Mesorhizobium TaxID=325217 RepID=UPI000A6271DE|nr:MULTISPECIES: YMGG-like glycine zipper-containing protein [unclassified Mesorhizobium]MDR7035178.1 putative membrane protein [Mesorhizobium sp. BE184]